MSYRSEFPLRGRFARAEVGYLLPYSAQTLLSMEVFGLGVPFVGDLAVSGKQGLNRFTPSLRDLLPLVAGFDVFVVSFRSFETMTFFARLGLGLVGLIVMGYGWRRWSQWQIRKWHREARRER